eukprot:1643082-Alexandrium_andersonii.AAC.1
MPLVGRSFPPAMRVLCWGNLSDVSMACACHVSARAACSLAHRITFEGSRMREPHGSSVFVSQT